MAVLIHNPTVVDDRFYSCFRFIYFLFFLIASFSFTMFSGCISLYIGVIVTGVKEVPTIALVTTLKRYMHTRRLRC